MFNGFTRWPDFYRGIAYIIVGLTILSYVLGFMERGFTVIIVICALALILAGCVKVGLYDKVMKMLSETHKHNKKE